MSGLFGGGNNAAQKQQRQWEAEQKRIAAEKAAAEEKARLALAREAEDRAIGRASTILTGGKGLLDDEVSAKRFLI